VRSSDEFHLLLGGTHRTGARVSFLIAGAALPVTLVTTYAALGQPLLSRGARAQPFVDGVAQPHLGDVARLLSRGPAIPGTLPPGCASAAACWWRAGGHSLTRRVYGAARS
jgi:hypothetical protein